MMRALLAAVEPLPPLATAIFGHSLGAVIGLELARWMSRDRRGQLVHFFPAGRPWPGRDTGERADLGALGDDALLEELDRRYGSLSSSLAHPEIRELALPALRADLRLLDSHAYAGPAALDCAVTAFGGTRDPGTTRESLEAWARETAGPFRLELLEGEHFFLEARRETLVTRIVAALSGCPPADGIMRG
jgi:surfactin synthase thioesterase subunit